MSCFGILLVKCMYMLIHVVSYELNLKSFTYTNVSVWSIKDRFCKWHSCEKKTKIKNKNIVGVCTLHDRCIDTI